jgi:hypothetical protein
VTFCTVVWYLTPLYFFNPTALFTKLSLCRKKKVNINLRPIVLIGACRHFYSPTKIVTIFGDIVAIEDIL